MRIKLANANLRFASLRFASLRFTRCVANLRSTRFTRCVANLRPLRFASLRFASPSRRSSGQSSCDICPSGTYQNSISSTSCDACGPGKYLYSTSPASHDSIEDCIICQSGKYTLEDETTNSMCGSCPTGKYNSDDGAILDNHIGVDSCSECDVGKFAGKKF